MTKEMTLVFTVKDDTGIHIQLKESSDNNEKFTLSEKVGLIELYKLNLLNKYYHEESVEENKE